MGLIVDNFAGGGGASTGIRLATGRDPDLAVNHDYEALVMYRENHPRTKVYCDDVFKVDPLKVTEGQPVELAWFSPDCKHFSKAKGGKPKSKKIRGLAWVMVKWAATVRPALMFLENVEEFQTWGPLLEDGRGLSGSEGSHVPQLHRAATQSGLPGGVAGCGRVITVRRRSGKRLFLIARCDGLPITWPEPTHGKPGSPEVVSGRLKPWRTAAECIDFSIPCPSIFEREKELAEATMRRIARGIRKFVTEADDPFIVPVTHPGDVRVHGLHEPFRTITGANRGELALISPHVTKFRTGATGSAVDAPLHTITAGPKDDPAGAAHAMGLVEAKLAPFLTEHANASGQRVFNAAEPLRTQCGEVKGGHFAEVCAFLAKHYGGHETPGAKVIAPADTITAQDHHALVAAHVVRHFGKSVGSQAKEPVGAICAGGMGKTGIVTSHLSKLYGTTTGHDAREPIHTITGGGNHIAEVRAFLIKYYGQGGQDQDCRDPMHTIPSHDRIGLVTIHGEEYVITDIGMRMLEPRELYLAQGFPADYKIAPKAWVTRGKKLIFRALPKHAQVRMCGNSVPPPMSEALVRANYSPVAEELAA
jgi:DNA (cytosine-5)-methyltransferase 1